MGGLQTKHELAFASISPEVSVGNEPLVTLRICTYADGRHERREGLPAGRRHREITQDSGLPVRFLCKEKADVVQRLLPKS